MIASRTFRWNHAALLAPLGLAVAAVLAMPHTPAVADTWSRPLSVTLTLRSPHPGSAPAPGAKALAARWLSQHGFTVTGGDAWTVTARAGAGHAAGAFGVTLRRFGAQVAPGRPAAVPAALRHAVSGVVGLDTRPIWHHHADESGIPGGLGPSALRAAYQVPATGTGAGETIATVQFSGWTPSDVVHYAQGAGISLAPGQITTYDCTVAQCPPTTGSPPIDAGGDFEVALDVESVLAGAPAAKQRVYVGDNSAVGSVAVYGAIADAAEAGQLTAVSTSWGECEALINSSRRDDRVDSFLQRILAAGVTIFAASGDQGVHDCVDPDTGATTSAIGVDYPASSPLVVAVGGTRLVPAGANSVETAWGPATATTDVVDAAGGGRSALYPQPSWQNGLALAGGQRLVPDISGPADPDFGIAIYGRGDPSAPADWYLGGGTSAAAPLMTGMFASTLSSLGRTTGIGDIHDLLYAHPQAFRDVVSGTNGRDGAAPGYDLVTGLGSPLWTSLALALQAQPPTVPSSPRSVAARPGNGVLTVNWAPPADQGDTPVTSYTVTTSPAGASLVVPASQSAATLTGLANATSYVAKVIATNRVGDSAPAAAPAPATPLPTIGLFTPVDPVRLLDTRTGIGAPIGRIGAGATLDLQVGGVGGVPANATAVVLNVTGVAPSAATDVRAYPAGAASVPRVSNLNLTAGTTRANLVTVKVGDGGAVRLRNAAGTIDLLADLAGYYAPGSTSAYHPLAPVRILDTRPNPLGPGAVRTLSVRGVAGVPAAASAVVLNVTGVGATQATDVRAYPGATPPRVSNLNLGAGETVPNLVTVKIGSDGTVRLRNAAGMTNLVADLAGYYEPVTAAPGSTFVPLDPQRILDTRSGVGHLGLATQIPADGAMDLQVGQVAGVPINATAVVLNVTGVGAAAATDVRVFPTPASGTALPQVSDLNLPAGGTAANLVVVKVGDGGKVRLRNAAGTIHLLADLAGFYTG